ncbi:uncharacterized protein AMSG_06091 [Thecamonas trahens ATCC 50062]|uniref:Uncharacterized protein n=1 Tax=Thecamonas trahens ATCC 50062 TaxID=461836 RepID=A0A0L0DCI9_THETB|nr:hypothetical protein AMSG_06091 [Thecamonas trahens ATCC 50062]KNC49811.1 hypothetical protein AMSG_06091 [Thecamonas trahens ATCC 50062]|eukprot:XP_013757594.1 hypothetical protein AMSG_06091 [Thecamonas trahens ATCC 50062]
MAGRFNGSLALAQDVVVTAPAGSVHAFLAAVIVANGELTPFWSRVLPVGLDIIDVTCLAPATVARLSWAPSSLSWSLALHTTNGSVAWTTEIGRSQAPGAPVSPRVVGRVASQFVNGVDVLVVAATVAHSPYNGSSGVVGLSSVDGSELWQAGLVADNAGDARLVVESIVAAPGGVTVYVAGLLSGCGRWVVAGGPSAGPLVCSNPATASVVVVAELSAETGAWISHALAPYSLLRTPSLPHVALAVEPESGNVAVGSAILDDGDGVGASVLMYPPSLGSTPLWSSVYPRAEAQGVAALFAPLNTWSLLVLTGLAGENEAEALYAPAVILELSSASGDVLRHAVLDGTLVGSRADLVGLPKSHAGAQGVLVAGSYAHGPLTVAGPTSNVTAPAPRGGTAPFAVQIDVDQHAPAPPPPAPAIPIAPITRHRTPPALWLVGLGVGIIVVLGACVGFGLRRYYHSDAYMLRKVRSGDYASVRYQGVETPTLSGTRPSLAAADGRGRGGYDSIPSP